MMQGCRDHDLSSRDGDGLRGLQERRTQARAGTHQWLCEDRTTVSQFLLIVSLGFHDGC